MRDILAHDTELWCRWRYVSWVGRKWLVLKNLHFIVRFPVAVYHTMLRRLRAKVDELEEFVIVRCVSEFTAVSLPFEHGSRIKLEF